MNRKLDILIVGAGIAGLSQAIKLAELDDSLSIGVVCKSKLQESNTRLAQGGIAAVMSTKDDSYDSHIKDTFHASQRCADQDVVSHVIEHAHDGIHQLEEWGIKFDHEKSNYHFGLEGGHSKPRILHVKDQTGAAVHDQLIVQVKKHSSVVFVEYSEGVELMLNTDGEIGGALIYQHQEKTLSVFKVKILVLATGGMGQLFEYTTNSSIATGDGIILARNVGAKISNLQAIQFHPTAFREKGKNRLFLISEAIRGAGAYIINKKGKRFLFEYDERAELATRDIISTAIYQEMKHSEEAEVYLDCRHLSKTLLEHEFPYILAYCLRAGFDLSLRPVPIIPAAHYSCGGIQVDLNGRTNIPHLYAIGECACTGLHGNNRLASNSLLEAIVLTNNVAETVCRELNGYESTAFLSVPTVEINPEESLYSYEKETNQLRQLLTNCFISKELHFQEEICDLLSRYKVLLSSHPQTYQAFRFSNTMELIKLLLKGT